MLKSWGWGGVVAHEILVSAQGPLVLGFWVWGFGVWGLGLDNCEERLRQDVYKDFASDVKLYFICLTLK